MEFLAPLLRTRQTDDYLQALARLQERMGELNDLFVARDHYQQQLGGHPQAWFALGWLAARLADARGQARPALRQLARTPVPRARSEG